MYINSALTYLPLVELLTSGVSLPTTIFFMIRFLLLCLACISISCTPKKPSPTLILINGKIWTADNLNTFSEAIAITGNTITAVGKTTDIKKLMGDSTRVIDLQGRLVIPGFNDAHIHFLNGARGLAEVELTATTSAEEVEAYIKTYVADHPHNEWITGRGWQYTFYKGGFPDRKMLDALVPDRPAYIRAYDGHTAWANSKALALAGIGRNYKFIGFGEVVRDGNGEPTGILKEDAMGLVSSLIPKKSRDENLAALRLGMKRAAELGITSIQNASGSVEETALYEALLANNELAVRTGVAFSIGDETSKETIADFVAVRNRIGFNNPMLKANAVKFMIDGVIEGHTAFMLEPYSDKIPKEVAPTGQVSMPLPRFGDLITTVDSLGFQIYTHAIGDRGVRETLNAYEIAIAKNKSTDTRHRIEHIETIHPNDIPRFAQLGVMPSMEPIHAEPGTVEVWGAAVGEKRLPYSFAWRSLLDANAKLVYSSDWPACISLNPIRGLHVAVNRRNPQGFPENGWVVEQKISVAEAVYAYTYMGAYASFEEKIKGKIAVGYLADLVVLSQDLFTIDPMDIHKTKVTVTVFNGRVIFEQSR
jgi:predicted amidohydrolase YtcJ